MNNVRKITEDLYWIGGNDRRLALFENIHPIPRGVSYNSYLLLDKKTVLFDTVDWSVGRQFLDNIEYLLDGRKLDYMVINHVEPDHAASIEEILIRYPEVKVVSTEKAFMLMTQFGFQAEERKVQVKEMDSISFGKHEIIFVEAPMVHWPEAMVSYDKTDKILFSADAFGSFGALNGKLFNDEVNFDRDWLDDARRYYTNIVGKYGPHVQHLLAKASTLEIKMICPLHGPVWRNDFGYILDKYDKWSKYEPEEKGVLIVYASMYGGTEAAADYLATKLVEKGMRNVEVYDVSSNHVSYLISESFKYSHIVLASVTYNLNIYPPMLSYIHDMKALNLQNRTFAVIENGSWAPQSGELIRAELDKLKNIEILDDEISIASMMTNEDEDAMATLADNIIESIKKSK